MSCPAPSGEPLPSPNSEEQCSTETEPKSYPRVRPSPTSSKGSHRLRPRWKLYLVIFAALLSFGAVLALAILAEGASQDYLLQRDCYPNGMWRFTPGATWRIMDSSYFFSPNLAFGSLSFTAVKVIDIVWDLVIGRGGQLVLGYVTYRVFNECLLYYMETHPTSYKLFAAVAFEPISLTALGSLGKECLALDQSSWKRFFRWLTMLCMLLSTLYVLGFPTLVSAMTGYTTTYGAYIEDNDGNLVEYGKFDAIDYIVHDSSRIGAYDRPLLVTSRDGPLWEAVVNYMKRSGTYSENDQPSDIEVLPQPSKWELDGSTIDLDSPTLNITFLDEDTVRAERQYTYEGRQGTVYSWPYMLEHGSCQPGRTYQWGFSYIFLFMMSIYNCIWTFIMCGMWIDTRRASHMYRSGHRPGLLRSVMDMSSAIREELGEEAQHYSNDELEWCLRESDGAMLVEQKELRVSRTDTIDMLSEAGPQKRRVRRWLRSGSTF
ncbi:hypothetical protein FQN54_002190 [Arachnomyces sp. PD_36]|nr:hypothetical protein FQN54_002190 [Arachnomyces sp. PD_36]